MKRVILILLAFVILAAVFWLYTPDMSRAALETRYRVEPTDYLEVAGVRLHLRDTGPRAAPALVLLHGFGSSLETWDAWAGDLSVRYRVIRYDLPGFALTGPDPTGDYSDRRSQQVLLAVLDRLGIGRATLVGNSIGGRLAWQVAARHPERVAALVLISPDGFASPGYAYGQEPQVPRWLGIMRFVLPRPLVRISLVPAYGDPAQLTPATVTRYWDMLRAPGARGAMIARLAQTQLEDPEPELQRIEAPTLLLWGERDGMIPVQNAADYQRNMTSARLVVLAGLGHVPQEEAPGVSLAPVDAFLSQTVDRQERSSAVGARP